jgi:hypothetical protein
LFSWSNRSRWHINHPIRRRSPDPLLVPQEWIGCSKSYRVTIKILFWYSWSPWKMGLDASWTNPIGAHFLISVWAVYGMGHTISYGQNFKFPSSDSWPPQNLGLDASWTDPIGEHFLISLWADYRMGHTGSYSQNFKFPSSDSQSPQNLGLDASWMKQIGEGHPTLSWCPNTIFGIAHATGWFRHPHVDIQNLLEKLVLVQVEPSQSEGVKFPTNKSTLIYCLLWTD